MNNDQVAQQVSYLLDGYECGHRSDVGYAIKCINEMWQLAASFPENQIPQDVWDAFKKMGVKYCPVRMTEERNKYHARKLGLSYTAPGRSGVVL